MTLLLLLLLLLHLLLPINSISSSPPCQKDHHKLLSLAFHSVSNFNLSHCPSSPLTTLKLPSLNLTGTISWLYLTNISTLQVLDLSHNSLTGSIPGSFWTSSSSLTHLNLAGNHLGGTLRFPSSSSLLSLNLSNNHFTKLSGLHLLSNLQVLDLSLNSINGVFPSDFPPLTNLHFLNLSFNNLSGFLSPRALSLFGSSSFQHAGPVITFSPPPPHHHPQNKTNNNENKKHKSLYKVVAISATSVLLLFFTLLAIIIFTLRKRRRNKRRKENENDEEKVVEQCAAWVAEAKWSSPVVIFEKPLMELTFADLAMATSCFSKDSQLADGHRCGPLYRAVLAGDMHVVIRVLKSSTGCDAEEISQLRHPNLLPLLGYCLAGKEKLFLYEYMEKGDMRRWLNELPAARAEQEEETLELSDWPARHKVALGVARGLAFLHQGSRRPVVHGHLVPENVLLDDEMEARVADFGVVNGGEGSVAEDVYGFGLLVLELVTGRGGWSEKEVERVRTAVREGRAAEVVDVELRRREGWSPEMEKETVEFVRVGYLCTAQCEVKRPTMQQVVGLLKDIRPTC